MAKNSVDIEVLKNLCIKENDEYIQKSGKAYIDSLNEIFSLTNKNDKPFTVEDIKREPLLKDFNFSGKNEYKYICKLHVNPMRITADNKRKNEKIKAIEFVSEIEEVIFKKSLGVSYILTCELEGNEHVIKIGSTRTTFKKRLGSYNCGTVNNWRTASTTNIKILQSMVATRLDLNLYIYDCSSDPYQITWHEITSVPFASPKSLAVEDIMIKEFKKQFGKIPLANVQANATEVD